MNTTVGERIFLWACLGYYLNVSHEFPLWLLIGGAVVGGMVTLLFGGLAVSLASLGAGIKAFGDDKK